MDTPETRHFLIRIALLLIAVIAPAMTIYAQGGYYINPGTITLPDTALTLATTDVPIPVNREDVKAIGMGKTQIADGRSFNAMMYNPALLARPKLAFEAASLQASMPTETFDAANYIADHLSEFKDALSLKLIWKGVNDFQAPGATLQQQLAALQEIQDGMRFPRDLLTNVIGSSDNPRTHAIRLIPAFAAQIGNIGIMLYGTLQSGFIVQQSPVVDDLLQVQIPTDLNDPQQVANAIASLQGILQAVVDANGNFSTAVFPVVYALSYADIVAAGGYGFDLTKNLSLGANLKIVNRRFSTERIIIDHYDNLLRNAADSLFNRSSVTGVTLDIGGTYRFKNGIQVGMSLQNVIPVQKISSTMTGDFSVSYLDYARDNNGNILLTNQGDTVVQTYHRNDVRVGAPFNLKLPFIANIGALYPITPSWDVCLDWVDIAAQDIRFDKYADRFRLGTEYRYDLIADYLGVAPRLGFADRHITAGLGLNLFRALQIDGAYAFDSFIQANSYYVQARVGW